MKNKNQNPIETIGAQIFNVVNNSEGQHFINCLHKFKNKNVSVKVRGRGKNRNEKNAKRFSIKNSDADWLAVYISRTNNSEKDLKIATLETQLFMDKKTISSLVDQIKEITESYRNTVKDVVEHNAKPWYKRFKLIKF